SRASAGSLPPAATIASIARLSACALKNVSITGRGRQFRLRTMRTLTTVLAWLVFSAGQAQTYPAKPVRIIVPYAAGGTSELVALAKAQPGKLNFAISGIGGAPHLAGIEFAQRMALQWTYIPYKGGSDAVAAVAAGQADVLFNGMLATWPTAQGGRLKALAISSAQRVSSAPDTPTVAEQGLPGFETGSFQGVVGPLGMARA